MFAFSTCWNSQRHTDGRAMLHEIRELGFEYAELGHGTRLSLVDGIQQAVAAGEIKISSLHNFCPLPVGVMGPAPDYYLPSTKDDRERACAVRHTLRTIDCAASLGARAVVLHLGLVAMRNYTMRLLELIEDGQQATPKFERLRNKALVIRAKKRQKFLDQVYRTLDEIVPRVKEMKVKLGIETRFGIEEIPDADEADEIITRYGADVINYWHDVGHAQVKENLGLLTHETLLERFRGRTAGFHLQDIAPPAHDHLPPGLGTFDFARLAPFTTDDMVFAWEIHHHWTAEKIKDGVHRVHELLRKSTGT
jgi:sugar phosphate isomerase/epimerase